MICCTINNQHREQSIRCKNCNPMVKKHRCCLLLMNEDSEGKIIASISNYKCIMMEVKEMVVTDGRKNLLYSTEL